jgi:hypothetical protein
MSTMETYLGDTAQPISPLTYAKRHIAACLRQMEMAPDDAALPNNERMALIAKLREAHDAEPTLAIVLVGQVFAYAAARPGLSNSLLFQQSFLDTLQELLQAFRVALIQPDATYTFDGRIELTATTSAIEPDFDADHSTRVHDARAACRRCLRQVSAFRQHVFLVEDAVGKGGERPLSMPYISALEGDMGTILGLVAQDIPAVTDFNRAIDLAMGLELNFDLLGRLDRGWWQSQWLFISDLKVLCENLVLAREDPTGARVY